MKVGRNDPCPCGSGKKYKKCCLEKDQEAERARRSGEHAQGAIDTFKPDMEEPIAPPPDPYVAPNKARWKEFEEQDYEGQIAVFTKTLNEEELMDTEMAFEMLNAIYHKSIEHNDRDRFDVLVTALREHLPDVYAHDAHYYLRWFISNALSAGRFDRLSALVKELAKTTDRHIDTFNNVVDQLAYHGQLSTLLEAMHIAWPLVQNSDNIVPWGISRFAEQAANYVIFDYLEHNSSPETTDPRLIERVEFYLEVDPERLFQYIDHLTGQADRHWTLADLEIKPFRSKSLNILGAEEVEDQDPSDGWQNLYDLSIEFLGYLHREESVPYTKAEVGSEQIRKYILKRHSGELEPRESMLEAMIRPRKHNLKPKLHKPYHLLCPDRITLDCYLGRLLYFINPQRYKAASTLELIPAWLRFLELHNLIDVHQHEKTLLELHGLDTDLLKLWRKHPGDLALQQGMKCWRENAKMRPPN